MVEGGKWKGAFSHSSFHFPRAAGANLTLRTSHLYIIWLFSKNFSAKRRKKPSTAV